MREQLPSAVISLMDELEAFARQEIGFDNYSSPLERSAFRPGAAATMVTHEEATIYLHDFDQVDVHAVAHELLHVWRYWIDGVPQLSPARNPEANAAACANFENTLEHHYIVPHEANYGSTALFGTALPGLLGSTGRGQRLATASADAIRLCLAFWKRSSQ